MARCARCNRFKFGSSLINGYCAECTALNKREAEEKRIAEKERLAKAVNIAKEIRIAAEKSAEEQRKLSELKEVFLLQVSDIMHAKRLVVASIPDIENVDINEYRVLVEKAIQYKRTGFYIKASSIWYDILKKSNSFAASIIDSWGKTLMAAGDVIDASLLAAWQKRIHELHLFYPYPLDDRINELRRLARTPSSFILRLKEYSGNFDYSKQESEIDVLSDDWIRHLFINDFYEFQKQYVIPRLLEIDRIG